MFFFFFMVFIYANTEKIKNYVYILFKMYKINIRTKRGWTYFIKYFDIPSSIFENCAPSNLKVSAKP